MDYRHLQDMMQNKDMRQRLDAYRDWLAETRRAWWSPDLEVYQAYLEDRGLAVSTVTAHLVTLRRYYRELLSQEHIAGTTAQLRELAHHQGHDVDTFIATCLDAMTQARHTPLPHIQHKHTVRHLGNDEICDLLTRVFFNETQPQHQATLQNLRDGILIGLMLCAGLTETEVVGLNRDDLLIDDHGRPVIVLPDDNDHKTRHVPIYDQMIFGESWLSFFIDAWQQHVARFMKGEHLLTGFYRGGNRVRGSRLTVHGIQKILQNFQSDTAEAERITGRNLRWTYARRLYLNAVSLETIQQNLGHEQQQTTVQYIGLPMLDSALEGEVVTCRMFDKFRAWEANHKAW